MPTATQIYKDLEDLSLRHDRLRKRFIDFFNLAAYLATGSSPIRGMTLDSHFEENFFTVAFCGRVFRFSFSLSLDQAGSSRGCVSCFCADPIDAGKRTLVTEFSYSGTGVTDIQKPDDIEDQITIDSDDGAVFLVCYCLHKGLTK